MIVAPHLHGTQSNEGDRRLVCAAEPASVSAFDLLSYLDATDTLRRLAPQVPKWLRQRVLKHGQAVCWHCEKEPAERVACLFSAAMGGDASSANVIPACARCAVRHRDQDPLLEPWAKGRTLVPSKAGRRLEALALCDQHEVPNAAKRSQALARAWLERHRWQVGPRVAVSAMEVEGGWLIGPVAVNPGEAWAALLMSIKQAGGQRLEQAPRVLIVPAGAWSGVVTGLIDRGALVWDLSSHQAVASVPPKLLEPSSNRQAVVVGGLSSRSAYPV